MNRNRKTLDVSGLKCPLPVVRAAKEMASLASGDELVVTATDAGSIPDMAGWANVDERIILASQETKDDGKGGKLFVHTLRKV